MARRLAALPAMSYHQLNPELRTRLPLAEHQRLHLLLVSSGLSLRDWLIAQINRCAAERLPESQGDVKKIVPAEVADLAQKVLELEANRLLEAAAKLSDRELRAERRREAGRLLDAADWFATVIEERRRRLFLLSSGQRQARHRHTSPQPSEARSQASNAPHRPARASQSSSSQRSGGS